MEHDTCRKNSVIATAETHIQQDELSAKDSCNWNRIICVGITIHVFRI